MDFAAKFLTEAAEIARRIDCGKVERMVHMLAETRSRGGRLFILGVGGSAANASHAVNDFRKIAGIESYAPTDNVSELTARTNDEGWANDFCQLAAGEQIVCRKMRCLVFSVGGGDVENNVSPNLVAALDFAKEAGATTLGIVGREWRIHCKGGGRLRCDTHG